MLFRTVVDIYYAHSNHQKDKLKLITICTEGFEGYFTIIFILFFSEKEVSFESLPANG